MDNNSKDNVSDGLFAMKKPVVKGLADGSFAVFIGEHQVCTCSNFDDAQLVIAHISLAQSFSEMVIESMVEHGKEAACVKPDGQTEEVAK